MGDSLRLVTAGGAGARGIIRCSYGIAVDRVPASDLSGLVELGEIELTASRESPLNPGEDASDYHGAYPRRNGDNDLLSMLRSKIRPEVVAGLNGLEQHGMIPARLGFVRGIASLYGSDTVRDSTLRWIPTIEPPRKPHPSFKKRAG